MNAMLFEQQIQIRIGKAARTPTLLRRDVDWFGLNSLRPYYSTLPSGSVQCGSRPRNRPDGSGGASHRRREVPPSVQQTDLRHVRDAIVRFCNMLDARPYFAALGNEIVVGIDEENCSSLFLKLRHVGPPNLGSSCLHELGLNEKSSPPAGERAVVIGNVSSVSLLGIENANE
jgi:hypothetical protein